MSLPENSYHKPRFHTEFPGFPATILAAILNSTGSLTSNLTNEIDKTSLTAVIETFLFDHDHVKII